MNNFILSRIGKQISIFSNQGILRHPLRPLYLSSTALPLAIFLLFWNGSSVRAQTAKAIHWKQVLRQDQDWYGCPEAIRIADNVLLYQHDNGGWLKNINMANELKEQEKKELMAVKAKGGTTIDNKATTSQMYFLQKVYAATGQEKYKEGFLRGLDYLLEAQYENGGWAQYYPIREGYYEHITFNDGAMIGVMRLLREVSQGNEIYSFVDEERRARATKALAKGLEVILKAQIEVDGQLTAWCAQHDRKTLEPAKARAYELPSLSGGESAGIVAYLMEIESPGPEVIRAIEAAISWMEKVKITGIRLEKAKDPSLPKGYDLIVINDPSASPLWARFYEIGTNRPIFVGRDGIVHYQFAEIEYERRVGYSYFVNGPGKLLEKKYPRWKKNTY